MFVLQTSISHTPFMQLFGIPNCNTVKKARDWLAANHIAYEFMDFKKGVANKQLLANWLEQQPWDKFVNRAGMTWRNLPDDEKALVMDAHSALNLMLDKNSIIKRPVLVKDGKIISIGFSEAIYKELLI